MSTNFTTTLPAAAGALEARVAVLEQDPPEGPEGPKGDKGVAFYGWSTASNLTNISSIPGMVTGDYVVNTGSATRTILGVTTIIGGIVRSTSATAGTAAGNIRGPAGATGSVGATGEIGPVGPRGEQGLQGIAGPMGPVGPMGEQGIQGVAGAVGPAGAMGATGATGPAGAPNPNAEDSAKLGGQLPSYYAPANHASTGTSYGIASGATYGHVRYPAAATTADVPQAALPYNYLAATAIRDYDLNNYRTAGVWTLYAPTEAAQNFPPDFGYGTTAAAFLEVAPFYSSTNIKQTLHKRNTNEVWVRHSTSATVWSAWELVELGMPRQEWHVICATAAATAAKTAVTYGFALKKFAYVRAVFVNANTAAVPTLNVNSTGAMPIQFNGETISSGMITAGMVAELFYDGVAWQLVNPATGGITPTGTSATAVSTTAKTTAISGFTLADKAYVVVTMTAGNTAASPTLNVTSTGAFGIRVHGGNRLLPHYIPAQYRCIFYYENDLWHLVNPAPACVTERYGEIATAAATTAKVATLSGFALRAGEPLFLRFVSGNTTASPTLNVNGTGARPILWNGAAPPSGTIPAGHVAQLVFNGSVWQLINPYQMQLSYTAPTSGPLANMTLTNAIAYINQLFNGENKNITLNVGAIKVPLN